MLQNVGISAQLLANIFFVCRNMWINFTLLILSALVNDTKRNFTFPYNHKLYVDNALHDSIETKGTHTSCSLVPK
jgi:hypothetical protein